jgi:hypothetical protein
VSAAVSCCTASGSTCPESNILLHLPYGAPARTHGETGQVHHGCAGQNEGSHRGGGWALRSANAEDTTALGVRVPWDAISTPNGRGRNCVSADKSSSQLVISQAEWNPHLSLI